MNKTIASSLTEPRAPLTNTFHKAVFFLSLVLISFLTLSPFDFTFNSGALNWKIFGLSPAKEQDWEIVINTLLYLPFGLGITGGFFTRARSRSKVLVFVLMISFLTSYFCEVVQSFLPSRFPSWKDVAANTLGGGLGSLTILWKPRGVALLFVWLFSDSS